VRRSVRMGEKAQGWDGTYVSGELDGEDGDVDNVDVYWIRWYYEEMKREEQEELTCSIDH